MCYTIISTGLCAFAACLLVTAPLCAGSPQFCDTNETCKLPMPADIAPGDMFGLDVGFAGTALCTCIGSIPARLCGRLKPN